MKLFWIKRFSAAIKAVLLCIASSTAFAQNIPLHAEGLSEELVAINIDNGRQIGVLSKRKGALSPSQLIVLLPGYPSVIRPEMANDMMVSSQLTGNFLIRARRHLASDQTMTLLVDCHTSVGSICTSGYQSSRDRYRHVKTLIETAREKAPSIKQVYLVSTSAGSISSAFIAKYGQSDFAGVIHTASIDPTAPRSYTELENFDYSAIKIPQAFIHHIDDPCGLTGYNYIRSVADRYRVPLITVSGGDGFTGDACNAHTQHGFKGKEAAVMQRILQLVRDGNWRPSRI
jgi:hypothetical protein